MPPLALAKYSVYWRPHKTGEAWTLLAQIPASPHPALLIKHSDLGDGEYDFAVRAVNMGGALSSLHTSLDATAEPYGGWYIVWYITK